MTGARLSARTALGPTPQRVGIAHLGLGAFHRAHQAVFTEDAMLATGDLRWGICGVTQRSGKIAALLDPQDCRYTVLERGPDAALPRVVSTLCGVLDGSADPSAVVALLAREDIRIITLTVTEKGYRHDPATGDLNLADPEIAADLTDRPPRTVVGQLSRGLQRRAEGGAGPVTVVSCDNLPANGRTLRRLVEQFIDAAGAPQLAAWVAERVRFPSTMVDRIVPATTAEDLVEVRERTGLRDEAAVVAEPFRQWVIEDDFATDRPRWELAGAVLVDDVEPWETLKLRVLNASHSMLAYLGLGAGYGTIAEAVADPLLADACRKLITSEVVPALKAPSGVNVTEYGESVLVRFANPALRHTTAQVAQDGSQKLGPRLLDTASQLLATGAEPRWAALGVAAWMGHVGSARSLDDPLESVLRAALGGSPADEASRLLDIDQIFAPELARHPVFRTAVITTYRRLLEHGVRGVLAEDLRA
ncbi:mannitol dehydrogenase family protein [Saccharopolyspora sp. K220]|uniref:mannitol dehydrogenase family protein n=1 Tax=Saccharopolyspora soli TaxID=2926618 RepID=UPI001F59B811|nr:mannitol dehydrogenase family protein [Saccharopolyspora soli]MCI2416324.1 mannitol dehydrogenase family protein [Saccharopolyspora soli]